MGTCEIAFQTHRETSNAGADGLLDSVIAQIAIVFPKGPQ